MFSKCISIIPYNDLPGVPCSVNFMLAKMRTNSWAATRSSLPVSNLMSSSFVVRHISELLRCLLRLKRKAMPSVGRCVVGEGGCQGKSWYGCGASPAAAVEECDVCRSMNELSILSVRESLPGFDCVRRSQSRWDCLLHAGFRANPRQVQHSAKAAPQVSIVQLCGEEVETAILRVSALYRGLFG